MLTTHETTARSRREFLECSALGFGGLAASCILARDGRAAAARNPLAAKDPPLAPRARSVIFLFMHGGPSHLDTFDPKPLLQKHDGQPVPESFRNRDFQFTSMDRVPLLGTPRTFTRHGQSGLEISDLFTNVARHADDLAVIRSCHHNGFTHITGQNWMNTGWAQIGRPSLGSWVVYGLGSESENLPAYVVMLDGGIKSGSPAYGSGFLPAMYQGTVLRSEGPPILNIQRPGSRDREGQRLLMDKLGWFNRRHLAKRSEDTDLEARMTAYELAFRMQTSAPEAVDVSGESASTQALYGLDDAVTRPFGKQCLLARRMVERGVRFIQLYSGCGNNGASPGWDGHNQIDYNHETMASQVDVPIAGLLEDLKTRGLLDETLVIWGGDFGRTPFTDGGEGGARNNAGRDHNPYGFTVWMAGGGVKGGKVIGSTDEIGLNAQDNKVHVHDLHATILTLLGLEHETLTYPFQGREFRLTDVGGHNNLAETLTAG
ncbi:MAG: DUF1501 domain-containing protein [Bryobacterales bacterium]|nr:DUF1501 domain-containing protein [Bryobacterales bacterium]MDE0626579.1 DUF1501 domain-containing protein [Bryobacterales bacterium]